MEEYKLRKCPDCNFPLVKEHVYTSTAKGKPSLLKEYYYKCTHCGNEYDQETIEE